MKSLNLITLASALLASSLQLAAASDQSEPVPTTTSNGVPAIDLASALQKLNAEVEERVQLDIDATVHDLRATLEDSVSLPSRRTVSAPADRSDLPEQEDSQLFALRSLLFARPLEPEYVQT